MSSDRALIATHGLADALGRGSRQVGTVMTLPGVVTAELLAEPFDLVWIDLEHGALGLSEAQDMIIGAQAAGALAFVRLGLARADGLVGPMLDAGANGIVAADVRSPAQAEWVAGLMSRPPVGRRGYGPRRSGYRGRVRTASRVSTPQLWLQIESQEGVAAALEIARPSAVDAVIVGIADLCVDLGVPIGLTEERLLDALWTVSDALASLPSRFGLAGPLEPAEPLGDLLSTASILIHSTDARVCAAAVDRVALALRGAGLASPSKQGATPSG
jgi:2-keto-3-deoxy-L-rhamnonate aldolase RhmA